MDRLLRLGGAGMSMGQNSAPTDAPVVDTAEQVYISSLALLKMLKHGRAGKLENYYLIEITIFILIQTAILLNNTLSHLIEIFFKLRYF